MDKLNLLTQQEKAVLTQITEGKSNPEIAEAMEISVHTVKTHIENIYMKLNVHNKVQAAVFALLNSKI